MTENQKYIINNLLTGSFITIQQGRYRMLDKLRNPQRSFTGKTYKGIKKLLRKEKQGTFVIDLRIVRAMNGNTYVKKQYKILNKKEETIL